MNRIILISLLVLPCTAIAEDCKFFEYPDHYEVECVDNAKPLIVQPPVSQSKSIAAPIVTEQQTSEDSSPAMETAPADRKTPSTADESVKKTVPVTPLTHRQGRPPTADRDAAAADRRKLILQQQSQQPDNTKTQ